MVFYCLLSKRFLTLIVLLCSLSPEPPFVLENELNDVVDFERSDLSENGDSYDTDEEDYRSLARPVPNDGYELSIYQGIQTHTLHAPCILTFVPYPDEPDFCRTLVISRDGSIDIRDGELSVDERDSFFASPINQGPGNFSFELSRDNFTLFAEPAWKVKARRRQRQRKHHPTALGKSSNCSCLFRQPKAPKAKPLRARRLRVVSVQQ